MPVHERRVMTPYKLMNHKTHVAYTKYVREGNIPQRYKAKGGREEMREILTCICKHIAEGMVEVPGGVYIKGWGYFFNWKCPRKMPYHINIEGGGREEHFNYHTNHYMYFPTYLPMSPILHPRHNWTMDKQFNHNIGNGVSRKLKAGFKYRTYMYSLKK